MTDLLARLEVAEADTKCVNAHDRCFMGGPCPYCEVICHRDAQGRFTTPATHKAEGAEG